MNKKKIFNKIVYSFLLGSLLLTNSIGTAQALFGGGPSIPSTGEIINEVETHYGFDKNILRRSQKKGDYPQVEVFFDKTAPEDGEEVTATAMPKYFKNTGQQLYYTWFLVRASDDSNLNGDLSDEKNLIEKAKQRAMGIVARGDFDPLFYKTDYSVSSDGDNDGYDASYGGDNGVGGKDVVDEDAGEDEDDYSFLNTYEFSHYADPTEKRVVDTTKITRCYRHNFGFSRPDEYSDSIYPGEDLIVQCKHKFPKAPEGETFPNPLDPEGADLVCDDDYEVGDGKFGIEEELCWQLDPLNSDTDGDGFVDEADLAGLGQQQLVWNYEEGDRVGVIIEGMSMVPINETTGIDQTNLNPKILYYCSNTVSDANYCVDADGDVGRCAGGTCNINTCTDPATDSGEPCETSGGGVGTCSFTLGTGTCEAVLSCGDPGSSDGDLCQDGGIAGICWDSNCVLSRCGDSGDKCQTDLGTIGVCNDTELCMEESVGSGDKSMNPYYKITWAGLDICDKEEVEGDGKEDLIDDDECEGGDDYGFTYLATKKVSQQAEELLKPTLVSNVLKAQVDSNNLDFSDYVNVRAVFDNQTSIDPDFIDYDWSIYLRNEDSSLAYSGELIGSDWVEGDLDQGMGASSIKFRGKDADFSDLVSSTDNLHFSVGLETSGSGKSKIATIDIPIVKNDIPIEFFDKDGSEICEDSDSSYGKICPVYPGQTLYAVYNGGSSESITGFSWELEGDKLSDKSGYYSVPSTVTSSEDYIVVPIVGDDMEIQTVSLKAKKDNDEEVTSERLLSVAKPMAKITSDDVTPVEVSGEESENVFIFDPGMMLFEAEMIPDYLDLTSEEITLNWYINNQLVDADFITANPGNAISLSDADLPQELEFAILDEDGDSVNLTLEVIKEYTDTEKDLLKEAWGIGKVKDLNFKKTITLKKNSSATSATFVKGNSISVFMASTLNNAPEYFIFIIKTAIVFVLFWSLLFGFNYWFAQEVRLKKIND